MAEKPETEAAEADGECEVAVKECEDAILECEDASLSCRYLLSVCVIIIILLGSLIIYLNLPYDENGERFENLTVYYLKPQGCVDCDLSAMNEVSSELRLDIAVVESDSVLRPSLFVVYGDESTLGLANSKLNMLSLLCYFADVKESCELRDEDIRSAVECLSSYNISGDAVVFYTQEGCERCSDMIQWIRQLRDEGYSFYTIDVDDEDEREIAEQCLNDVLDLHGVVPQFACAAKGRNSIGAFTSIEQMTSFAEDCKGS
ncbi:MAG: hypothetical protein JW778_01705 [Candidatus Altiarchaeota archaeon]|nr:hypothetical protein [Candidatus Altiarchaeota archaeon]